MSAIDVPVRLDDLGQGVAAVDDDPEPALPDLFAQLGQCRVLAHRHPGPDPRAAGDRGTQREDVVHQAGRR